jgi:hypothetical protein
LSSDEALIALMIAAMESSGNVAPIEAARAARLVRLLPQLRRHSGLVIGRMIERMKAYVASHDDTAVIAAARDATPPPDRAAAFMTVTAVLLSDHRIQRAESDFLMKLNAAFLYSRPERKMPRARPMPRNAAARKPASPSAG